jgi:transcriptional regulator GlxA family with amidase domain
MKHVSILVPTGAVLGSIEGPRQVFIEANKYLQFTGRELVFDVQFVGLKSKTPAAGGKYTIYADALVNELNRTDSIIIPALDGNMEILLQQNRDFIPWIQTQYAAGAEVASLCVGAFLLAATGLVDGKKCATHWMAANDFKRMFPKVDLVEDGVITDEGGIYSSGGAFSYLNLILYLIEKFAGRDVAVFMSKAFQIDIERKSQSPFRIFSGQKDHDDVVIREIQDFIEGNAGEKISVDQLTTQFALSRRNLERRFKKATFNSVNEYIQRVKVEAAKMKLESSRETVYEIMYAVGYNDSKAFRSTFKKITGLSPVAYRNKYAAKLSMVA